jgi:L-ascorbate metabolism protein UlaG (beta-lactamase superfamily)
MKVTYFGHACFGVQVAQKRLLFDPFITPNPLAKNVNLQTVPADYILISHGHGDHLADAVAVAKRTGATVVSNYEITVWLGNQGVTNCHPLNHGGAWKFEFGRVKFVNAIHSSGLPDGTYGGNPGGFVVETNEGNFYYSGDTALSLDMKLIGDTTPLKFAVLCIGDNFTMGLEDAARAADFIKCRQILGVHYDTFPPIQIDRQAAVKTFQQSGKNLVLLPIGQSHLFA